MVHRLQLGNQHFALTDEDVEKLNSPFLSALLDASTPFSKPDDGIYQIDADAQCFAAFLVLAQYGTWTRVDDDRDFCLQQADFWGIREKIIEQICIVDHNKTLLKKAVATVCSLREKLDQAKRHHNSRRHDKQGKVCCVDCGLRVVGSLIELVGAMPCPDCQCRTRCRKTMSRDRKCRGCGQNVPYQPDLGLCHKCDTCTTCQTSECPNNIVHYNYIVNHLTTDEIRKELLQADKELASLF
jgi:hypothetical protein